MPVSSAGSGAVTIPAALARSIDEFLGEHPGAAIFEDGRLLFDLRLAHCSVTADRGRCLLHLWSDERNLVRTVVSLQPRREMLRLETLRFGQTKPQMLTLVPDPDFRTALAKDTARRQFLRKLEEALRAEFPEWQAEGFRSAMDLEHSFGPAYARGVMSRGQSAWAVLGVGPDEPPAVIEGALTLGILWLAYCREHGAGKRVFQGLRLVVPEGCTAATRARMAWLNPAIAQWELFELSAKTGRVTARAVAKDGNLNLQLLHALDTASILERSAATIAQLRAMLPAELDTQTEIRAKSATEIA
ncbi:MAG TPA: hypothetical protein VKT77_21220, partial [Chthonomonadaceae bacterium]|nr:hypothetical protein [Chthonomonadaceae bacterium]